MVAARALTTVRRRAPVHPRATRSLRRARVVTLDRDPAMRFFGARRHHVAPVEDLATLGEAPFDVVIANGVLGWGVDTPADAERAVGAMADALRPGGMLVLGINEARATTPPLDQIAALRRLVPAAPPPFGAHRYVVPSPFEGSHTFLFFTRPIPRRQVGAPGRDGVLVAGTAGQAPAAADRAVGVALLALGELLGHERGGRGAGTNVPGTRTLDSDR